MSPPSVYRSLLLIGLVACLALSPVAALHHVGPPVADGAQGASKETAKPDDQTRIVEVSNTSNYLVPKPGQSNRQEVGHIGVDVAAAVSISSAKLHSRHDRLAFEKALANARPNGGKIEVIKKELDLIAQEATALKRSQREVLAAYTNKSITTDTLLRRLAQIDAAADGATTHLERVRAAIDEVGVPTDIQTRRYNVEGQLIGLGGPASSRIGRAIAGRGPATDAYVAVMGDHGLVVTTVGNSWVYREAYDESQLGTSEPDQFAQSGHSVTNAVQRAEQLYPWTFNNSITEPYGGASGSLPLYYTLPEHPHGELTIYLDGRTRAVFREIQRKRVEAVPVSETLQNTNGTLSITANTTSASWPLSVTVSRTDTGNAADATIRISGSFVGKTGPDGTLTTVQPDRPFTVNATTDNGESVELTVGS